MMKRIVWMMLIGMASVDAGYSQMNISAEATGMADDNVSNSYEHGADRITLYGLKAGYTWNSQPTETRLLYYGAFSYYTSLTDRTFQYHSMGLMHTRSFGDEDAGTVEFAAEYAVRKNRDSFTLFDHATFGLEAAAEYYFTELFAGEARYQFHSTVFSQLGDFDYRENVLSLKASRQLFSTTTVILQSEIDIKSYAQQVSGDSSGALHGGMVNNKVPRAIQWSSSVRIGQSLGEKTGVSLSAGYRYNFQQSARYLSSEYGSLSDDELFNDHYGYEGLRTGILLTQLLPADLTLRLRMDQEQRAYALQSAYDLSGVQTAAQRSDTYRVFSASCVKHWENFPLTLMFTYEYIKNASNDAYYDYTNNVFSVGLTVPF
ncbi:MAG TPA: surface lipoprotein assembly modifier [Bacteroidota bacterium]|nr:surface lipoprotein assembly modifier [Bacteroidota bacterium]